MTRIYLDHAATTPLCDAARIAMIDFLSQEDRAHNPSSLHFEGRSARALLDTARAQIAQSIGASARDIIFTSSGSESVSLALMGFAEAAGAGTHLITSNAEHQAVLSCADRYNDHGLEVTILAVDANGCISLDALESALQQLTESNTSPSERTALPVSSGVSEASKESSPHQAPTRSKTPLLKKRSELQTLRTSDVGATAKSAVNRDPRIVVSLMLVNNELGTINDIRAATDIAHRYGAVVHCDAIAAAESVAVSVPELGVDALSLAAHKFGGPIGCAILAVPSFAIAPLTLGGGQERSRRAGTEDLLAIVGGAAAFIERAASRPMIDERLRKLRNHFEVRLSREIPGLRIQAATVARTAAISHIAIDNVDPEGLLAALDLAGIAASSGSACASGAATRSYVARAIGIDDYDAVVRFSFGRATSTEGLDEACSRFGRIVARIREG